MWRLWSASRNKAKCAQRPCSKYHRSCEEVIDVAFAMIARSLDEAERDFVCKFKVAICARARACVCTSLCPQQAIESSNLGNDALVVLHSIGSIWLGTRATDIASAIVPVLCLARVAVTRNSSARAITHKAACANPSQAYTILPVCVHVNVVQPERARQVVLHKRLQRGRSGERIFIFYCARAAAAVIRHT